MSNKTKGIFVSIVTPAYKCEGNIELLYNRLINILEPLNLPFEIIYVNDGSPHEDWNEIKAIANKDKRVIGINFSRNFGQHNAITAGLSYASGEWIVVMDCDLQDRPEEIPRLIEEAKNGYDIVVARRSNRQDNLLKKAFSFLFYRFLSYLTETKQDATIANFGIYNSKVIKAVLMMGDNIRYFPTMVRWVGFKRTSIEVAHAERDIGKTAYNLKKMMHLALDVILSFSEKPLRLTIKLGLWVSGLALLFAIYNLYEYFNGRILVPGWTSLIISVWFLSGLIIFVLGVVGLYIGKTFQKVKNRPVFIIDDIINKNE